MTEHAEPGIDPDDLATTLRVLDRLHELPADHPDIITIQRATSAMYKTVKVRRRARLRAAEIAADRAVIETTATGHRCGSTTRPRGWRSSRRRPAPSPES